MTEPRLIRRQLAGALLPRIGFALLLLPLSACEPATKPKLAAPQQAWQEVAAELSDGLERALLPALESGDVDAAVKAVDELYYGRFEPAARNMEVAIRRQLSIKAAAAIEASFLALKRSLRARHGPATIRRRIERVKSLLAAAGRRLDAQGVTGGDVIIPPAQREREKGSPDGAR